MDPRALQLALLYDAHNSQHMEDLPFWQSLVGRQAGPFLELGCGSGRILLPLARSGNPAFGVDSSAEMLAVLQKNTPPDLPTRVQLLQADMTRLCCGRSFNLILLPCNTYSTFTAAQRQNLLAGVRGALSRDGTFAVSVPNPLLLASLPARSQPQMEEDFPHPLDGEPVQVSSGWQRTTTELSIDWHYDHLLPDGTVRRHSLQVTHRLVYMQDYLYEIEQAGLVLREMYGDYDRSPYEQDSPHLIFLAGHRP